MLTKNGIELNISHDHLTTEGILKFLSKNDLNVFFYEHQENRGISSATDWAISVKRPLVLLKARCSGICSIVIQASVLKIIQ